MTRKTATVVIEDDNRDKGKTFLLTEMSASAGESWALEALHAMIGAGIELPEGVADAGMAGIATMGLTAFGKMPFGTAKPLLDRLLVGVLIIPNPATPNVKRTLVESDIDEISTMLKLRFEAFKLNLSFQPVGSESTPPKPTKRGPIRR